MKPIKATKKLAQILIVSLTLGLNFSPVAKAGDIPSAFWPFIGTGILLVSPTLLVASPVLLVELTTGGGTLGSIWGTFESLDREVVNRVANDANHYIHSGESTPELDALTSIILENANVAAAQGNKEAEEIAKLDKNDICHLIVESADPVLKSTKIVF